MTQAWLNRCIWLATSAGLVDFVVSAAQDGGYVPSGCNNPAVVDGATYHYFAVNGTEHEEGTGTWTTSTSTLARTTVRNSSNSGSKVNFSSAPTVYMGTPAANDLVTLDSVTSLTVTNNSLTSVKIQSAASGSILDVGAADTGTSLYVASDLSVSDVPISKIKFTPDHFSSTWQTLVIEGNGARVQIIARDTNGAGLNPQLVLGDLNCFGVPVGASGNQPGAGILMDAVAGSSQFNFNLVNLGGGGSGEWNSCVMSLWGTSVAGDTQNFIAFYNGAGSDKWDGTFTATVAGARLGEIGGFGSLPDGHFTQTETWSWNAYAEQNWSGTTTDGSYNAATNMVLRLAPASLAPERITAVFDYNANLLIGDAWASHGNAPGGNISSGVVIRGAPQNYGQLSIKWNKTSTQAIAVQNDSGTDGGGGTVLLVHNGAGTQIGNITHNGTNVAYNTSSDRRLKKDIRNADLAEMANIVSRLTVVRHGWNSHDHETYGFIAQDEYLVFPDAVTPGDDGALNDNSRIWQRDDSKLVVPLVGAMQHVVHRMDDVENRVTALEQKMAA